MEMDFETSFLISKYNRVCVDLTLHKLGPLVGNEGVDLISCHIETWKAFPPNRISLHVRPSSPY